MPSQICRVDFARTHLFADYFNPTQLLEAHESPRTSFTHCIVVNIVDQLLHDAVREEYLVQKRECGWSL